MPRWILIALLVVLLALVVGGLWFYRGEEQAVWKKEVEQLTAIGQLKVDRVAAWRAERLADAAVLMESPFLNEEVVRFLANPDDEKARPLLARFRSLQIHGHYADVLLVDEQGRVRLSLADEPLKYEGCQEILAEVLREQRPVFTELHAGGSERPPHIGVAAPLFSPEPPNRRLLGAMVLVSDAAQFLYPLIRSWPTPSQTAETLLVRRDGDEVRFLNDLRHQANAALQWRLPLSRTDAPAVMAVQGRRGVVEGIDYRGVRVLAFILPVPDSSWFLVAKEDRAEVFAEWRFRRNLMLAVFLTLVGALMAVGLAVWQRSRKAHYQALYAAESQLRMGMERFSITLKSIGDAVIATDVQGRVRFLNPVAETLTGWSDGEAQHRPLDEVFHIVNEETRKRVETPVTKVLREGITVELANHTVLIARDGSARPIADSASPIRDDEGKINGVVLVFRDQTTEQNYRMLFRKMLDGFASHEIICDEKGIPVDYRFLDVNPSFERLTGKKAEDIIGKTLLEVFPGTERYWIDTYGRVAITGEPIHFENYSGELDKYFEVTAFRPAPYRFAVIFEDITERKRAEAALKENEKRYRSLTDDVLDNTEVGVFILNADFKVVWMNHAMERFFGLSREMVIGKDKRSLIREQIADRIEEPASFVSKVFATYDDNTYTEQFECHVRSGPRCEERWLLHSSQPIRSGLYAGGRMEHYYDITERKQKEAEQKRLMAAIEQSGDIVIVTDADGAIRYVNRTFEVVTGYTREEVIGQNPRLLQSGQQDAAFYRDMWTTLLNGHVFHGRMVNQRKDGSFYTEDAAISPVYDEAGKIVHYVSVSRDMTDRLQMEAKLLQAQKMESVGRLAGGVAHDFNNMLSVILGHAELAMAKLDPSHPIRPELQEIINAGLRSVGIIRQLLAFARKQIVAPQVLDLNETVEGMLKMLRRLMGEDIDLVWRPGTGLRPVKIDPAQIHQILANLCVNARDAIADVGQITIETDMVTRTEVDEASAQDGIPGDFIRLTVRDDGCGMDAETVSHLFEPFFTTKEVGKGTGLGLATVLGIVQQNNGFITVDSVPGGGTSFKIHLPCHGDVSDALEQENPASLPRALGETILVVEDESAILRLATIMLEKLGYTVLAASSPEEALRLAQTHVGRIHLLMTDVVMPGMNGRELSKRLRERDPELKCLFMSGYTADVIAHHGVLDEDVFFMEKPFSKQELATGVRKALNRD